MIHALPLLLLSGLDAGFSFLGAESTSPSGFYSVGWTLAGVGDIDGDGLGDFAVGAPAQVVDADHQGRIFFFSGGPSARSLGTVEGLGRHTFGFAIATLGDVNGDGAFDFAVGSPATEENGVNTHRGEVIFFRSDRALTSGPEVNGVRYATQRVPGARAPSDFGRSLVFVGGAQKALFAAAPWFDVSTGSLLSAVDGTTLATLEAHALTRPGTNDRAGYVSFRVEDLDGDSVLDLAVCAPGQDMSDPNFAAPGRVYLYSGATGSLINVLEGGRMDTHLGFSAARIGDIDGDGIDELLVGAPYQAIGTKSRAGAAWVVRGSAVQRSGDVGPRVITLPAPGATSDIVLRTHEGSATNELVGFAVAALQKSRYAISAPGGAGQAGRVTVYQVSDGAVVAETVGEPGSWSGYTLLSRPQPPELVVGSPLYSAPGLTFSGRIDTYDVPGWVAPCVDNGCGGCKPVECPMPVTPVLRPPDDSCGCSSAAGPLALALALLLIRAARRR